MNMVENNRELLEIVLQLVYESIPIELSLGERGLEATFSDGFYKSDGDARLVSDIDGLVLLSRYDKCERIDSVEDVIRCSMSWYDMSRSRFKGWANPPEHWKRLYDALCDLRR